MCARTLTDRQTWTHMHKGTHACTHPPTSRPVWAKASRHVRVLLEKVPLHSCLQEHSAFTWWDVFHIVSSERRGLGSKTVFPKAQKKRVLQASNGRANSNNSTGESLPQGLEFWLLTGFPFWGVYVFAGWLYDFLIAVCSWAFAQAFSLLLSLWWVLQWGS